MGKSKVIVFYSGKGGVGKSTISSAVANKLAETHKVVLVDGDIKAPSQHLLNKDNVPGTLTIMSEGLVTNKSVNYGSRYINSLLKSYSEYINRISPAPEYIIIDTAPGLEDSHKSILKNFNISTMIMISQNTELSFDKIKRTAVYFGDKGINIGGIVLNMVDNESGYEFPIPVISEIPNRKNGVLKEEDLSSIMKILEKSDSVDPKEFVNEFILPNITKEDLKDIVARDRPWTKKKLLRFYNVETWDFVRRWIREIPVINNDLFLEYNDTETIKRVLDHFKSSKMASFMIVRSPSVEIPLFSGEIGFARLVLGEESYYGVPRISYFTDEGEVILFPHEVKPVDHTYINEGLHQYKEIVRHPSSETERYIPTKDIFVQIFNQFGANIAGDRKAFESIFNN